MGLIESTKEAVKGGFKGIKKVRGLLTDIQGPLDPPETWDSKDKQVLVIMDDVTILEMFNNEEAMELKDNHYTFYIKYAPEGKTPTENSAYMKCWVASAERLGKKPSDFKGQYVTLEKIPLVLFHKPVIDETTKKPKIGEDGKKILEDISATSVFSFVPDEGSGTANVKDYLIGLLDGKNQTAARRVVVMDARDKQFPEWKAAWADNTIAE